jgi:uncharacterized protein DUF3732
LGNRTPHCAFCTEPHFQLHNRPVPQFLVLDQPSQVGFQADPELADTEIKDDARVAVARIYDFIFKVVESLAPKLQVIITDHANFTEQKFQEAIIETWRGTNALVPDDWITKS